MLQNGKILRNVTCFAFEYNDKTITIPLECRTLSSLYLMADNGRGWPRPVVSIRSIKIRETTISAAPDSSERSARDRRGRVLLARTF